MGTKKCYHPTYSLHNQRAGKTEQQFRYLCRNGMQSSYREHNIQQITNVGTNDSVKYYWKATRNHLNWTGSVPQNLRNAVPGNHQSTYLHYREMK